MFTQLYNIHSHFCRCPTHGNLHAAKNKKKSRCALFVNLFDTDIQDKNNFILQFRIELDSDMSKHQYFGRKFTILTKMA